MSVGLYNNRVGMVSRARSSLFKAHWSAQALLHFQRNSIVLRHVEVPLITFNPRYEQRSIKFTQLDWIPTTKALAIRLI